MLLKKIKKAFFLIKIKALTTTLKCAGFIHIRGHWIYAHGLSAKPLIIDFGANKGDFSKEMKKKYGAECYIAEPNKELFDSITTISADKKFNVAITPKDEKVTFYLSNNPEAGSLMESFEDKWGNTSVTEVDGLSWKTFLKTAGLDNQKIIDVLKVDIEGAELGLIESFEANDLIHVKQITIEYHDWLNKNLHQSTIQTIKKLNQLGFAGFTNTPNHSWPVEIVFINKSLVKFNFLDKIFLGIFNRFAFLKYHR